jgi:hypothetical protein
MNYKQKAILMNLLKVVLGITTISIIGAFVVFIICIIIDHPMWLIYIPLSLCLILMTMVLINGAWALGDKMVEWYCENFHYKIERYLKSKWD